jgi:TPR repeat protein
MKKYVILLVFMLLTLSPLLSGCGNSNEQVNKVVKSADQIALEEQAKNEYALNIGIQSYVETLLAHYTGSELEELEEWELENLKQRFIENPEHSVYRERLAQKGDEDAQLNLAFLYYHGIVLPKDFKKAFYWFQQASIKKDRIHRIQSLYFLGKMYANAEGVKQNYPKAIESYQAILKEMKNIEELLKTENSKLRERLFDHYDEDSTEPDYEY